MYFGTQASLGYNLVRVQQGSCELLPRLLPDCRMSASVRFSELSSYTSKSVQAYYRFYQCYWIIFSLSQYKYIKALVLYELRNYIIVHSRRIRASKTRTAQKNFTSSKRQATCKFVILANVFIILMNIWPTKISCHSWRTYKLINLSLSNNAAAGTIMGCLNSFWFCNTEVSFGLRCRYYFYRFANKNTQKIINNINKTTRRLRA
jgi:hypothetical protein